MSAEKKNAVRETFSEYFCVLLVREEIVNLKQRNIWDREKEDLIIGCGLCRLRGGAWHLCSGHDSWLLVPHPRLPPALPDVRGEGGPGVRESRHLQTGSAADRRSPGAGSLLHHPLCGYLREDRYEIPNFRDSTSRGW